MSSYLKGLTLRCRLGNPYRKMLLFYLADRADEQTGKTTEASISYLAYGLEVSETTIKKYRRELSYRKETDKKEDIRFGLLSWKGSKGYGGSAVYTIDVEALKKLSEEWTPGDHLSKSNRREATIPPAAIDAARPLNSRVAPTNLPNEQTSNEHQEKTDLSGDPYTSFLSTEATRAFAPDYKQHPAALMYLEAFKLHPQRLQPYNFELLASRIEVSPASLEIWKQTLEDYRSVIGWNPLYTNNLFDRYWRYRNNEIDRNETGPGSGIPRDPGEAKDQSASEGESNKRLPKNFRRPAAPAQKGDGLEAWRSKYGYS